MQDESHVFDILINSEPSEQVIFKTERVDEATEKNKKEKARKWMAAYGRKIALQKISKLREETFGSEH